MIFLISVENYSGRQDGNDVVIEIFDDRLVIKDTLINELDENQFVIQ